MSPSDVSAALEVLDSLDLPKDPIAWLMVRAQEKADHYRETGNELKAREMDDRAGSLRVRLRNARTATIGDERSTPEFFDRRELDRLLAQPRQSTAHARVESKQILARRKAASQPNSAKAPLTRTHVEKWIDDHEDRARLLMTMGDFTELMACLERDDSPSAVYLSQNPALTDRAMTPNDFKQLAEAVG
jgi:hypothetical protein